MASGCGLHSHRPGHASNHAGAQQGGRGVIAGILLAIGASIGGIAGVIFATKVISITPDNFVFQFSILFVAAVVLGGSGNLAGVIVGAAVVGYLPERFRSFQDTRYLWFGAALVVMMIFRPQGLVPARRRQAEIKDVTEPGGSSTGPLGAEVVGEDEVIADG